MTTVFVLIIIIKKNNCYVNTLIREFINNKKGLKKVKTKNVFIKSTTNLDVGYTRISKIALSYSCLKKRSSAKKKIT